MRHAARFACLVVLVLGITVPTHAAPHAQGTADLSTPLRDTFSCGAGLPGETHFTLAATGDTFPHENIQAAAEANGYDWLFDNVRPFLAVADVAYTNFDGAMLEGAGYTGYPTFNYNPALAAALKNAHVDLVSTANNHILDRGPEGLDATMQVLARNSIRYHGTVPSSANGVQPPYLPVPVSNDGVTVTLGFVSASWGTNGIPDPYNQVNLLFDTNSYGAQGTVRPEILAAVAQAKRETDLVVVAAHWGVEYQFYPNDTQTQAAQKLAEAGADIILGAQPHTLQPVDIIDTGGRKTLVIYSLANFLASQGAFQDPYFSATSTILYVGFVRSVDGTVRVTGYRYLPTIHVDGDTRPAPIPITGYEGVIEHVRTILRDPNGARQIGPDPVAVGEQVAICPTFAFEGQPEATLGGDFAAFYRTLGSAASTVVGIPNGPARQELKGDCQTTTSVVYTPFQRLEWHPEAEWPYRVVGTQLGTLLYRQNHGGTEPQRGDVNAITSPAFRAFYEGNSGQVLFGLPISTMFEENGNTVQYFERARFEAVPGADPNAPPEQQVRLGRLGEEYGGIAAQCNLAAATTSAGVSLPVITNPQPARNTRPAQPATSTSGRLSWLVPLIMVLAGLIVVWYSLRQATKPRAAARVRARDATRRMRVVPRHHDRNDDEVLRDLLDL